jgi:pantetheine-phosphate adenylyltransferase
VTTSVIALYPGTFDPLTKGHENIILRSCDLFNKVVVAVAFAHHKKTLFSVQERLQLVQEVFKNQTNVEVVPFNGLVTAFANQIGATVMVRGLRGAVDLDYELQLAGMNRQLAPHVETIFLSPDDRYQHISSTLVREIAKLGGAFEAFVPRVVTEAMQKNLATRAT